MERTPPSFRHAERFAGELSPRQREVLRLIAEGKTNGEIAEALGMTLAGAKWHVSELLSKLGFDVREEAAAFYRWQHGRGVLVRALRAITGFGLVRPALAAGTLALAAVGVAIAVVAVGGESAPPEPPGRPFYLEARSIETQGQTSVESSFKWWRQDATHERTEVTAPAASQAVSFSVFDGVDNWSWHTGGGLYRKLPHPKMGCAPCFPMYGGVGPLDAPDLDAYLAEVQKSDPTAHTQGSERLLGRRTVRVERASSPGSPQRTTDWIDPERMIVMRSARTLEAGSTWTIEVTRLEYDVPLSPSLFVFSPPPGGVEDRCTSGGPQSIADKGFLAPTELPAGHTLRSWGFVAAADGTCGQAHLEYDDTVSPPGMLQVGENREDPESVITGPRDDPREIVPGVTAFAWNEPGYALVAWVHDGLGVQLKSDTMTIDALLEFGRALLAPPAATPTARSATTPVP